MGERDRVQPEALEQSGWNGKETAGTSNNAPVMSNDGKSCHRDQEQQRKTGASNDAPVKPNNENVCRWLDQQRRLSLLFDQHERQHQVQSQRAAGVVRLTCNWPADESHLKNPTKQRG